MGKRAHNFNDLTGQKFNRLTVIDFAYSKNWAIYWNCLCECGGEKIVKSIFLRTNSTKSCGCLFRKGNNLKHGLYYSKFYKKWYSIKTRCFNKNEVGYPRYGGRGITVCERWLKFLNFRNDMYQSYLKHSKLYGEENTTIERIDNNRRTNNLITYKGTTLTLMQWARKLNINRGTLWGRLNKNKWSVEKSFIFPVRKRTN